MAGQTPLGSTKIPMKLVFGTTAIGNADGTLYTTLTSVLEYRMMQRGSVIGFSANLSGTLATGTLQFAPTKNGTRMSSQFTNGTINIGTLGNHERAQAQQGNLSFNEGDTIGLMFNKTGTITPTTRDCEAIVMVLLESYDY
jgi:hypothetical protein